MDIGSVHIPTVIAAVLLVLGALAAFNIVVRIVKG